jgi:hypothetical protein
VNECLVFIDLNSCPVPGEIYVRQIQKIHGIVVQSIFMKINIFLDVTPCSLVDKCECFRGIYCSVRRKSFFRYVLTISSTHTDACHLWPV